MSELILKEIIKLKNQKEVYLIKNEEEVCTGLLFILCNQKLFVKFHQFSFLIAMFRTFDSYNVVRSRFELKAYDIKAGPRW